MTSRKGDVYFGYIIAAVLGAIVLLLIFTGAWKTVQPIVFAVELFGFNVSTAPQGDGIIGLNLAGGELEYYNGERFKEFTNQGVAVLGGYEFNIKDTENKINDFYFKTSRRPEKLSVEVNHWRYWDVSLGSSNNMAFILNFKNKESFDNLLFKSLEYAELDSNGNPVLFDSYDGSVFPRFGKIELDENKDKIAGLIAWRDSILQGNSCEKFLTLRVKHNGVDKDLIYTVRKSEGYLAIDLTKPIEFGIDKWSNEKCFKFENYVDIPVGRLANVSVELDYTEYDGADNDRKLTWDGQKWIQSPGGQEGYYVAFLRNNFYDGLIALTKPSGLFEVLDVVFNYNLKTGQGVFIGNEKIPVNIYSIGNEKEWNEWKNTQSLNNEIISDFIYRILDEYAKHQIIEGLNQNA